MNVLCSAKACPVLLSSTCVFYEGENLIFTGINTNDNLQEALQKIDDAFGNAILDISAVLPISVTAGPNPIISISQASATSNGYISSTDWNIFNNKQNTVSLTTVGSTGPSTFNSLSGELNIPDYSVAFPGFVPTSRTLTINGTSYDLSANRSWSVGTVTSISTSGPLTGGTITGSGTIGITQSSGSTDGYLSSTDWNTFNNKQNALTNPVTGIGTVNYISKWTTSSSLGNSLLYDNGTSVGVKTNNPYAPSTFSLDVNGGLLVKNTAGTTAQITLINADPSIGGNSAFVVHSVGGTFGGSYVEIQGYYGTSVTGSTAIRLNPYGGNVLVGTTVNSSYLLDVNGTARVSNRLTLGENISYTASEFNINDSSFTRLRFASGVTQINNQNLQTLTFQGVSFGSPTIKFENLQGGSATADISTLQIFPTYSGLIGTTGRVHSVLELHAIGGPVIGTPGLRYLYINPSTSGFGFTRAIESVSGDVLLGTTSGSVGIGVNTTINASAIVDITSTTKGVLLPRLTSTQRTAISSPATGLFLYDTTDNEYEYYNGTAWTAIQSKLTNPVTGSGATGQVAYWNGTNSQTGSNNLFWDDANARLGIGGAASNANSRLFVEINTTNTTTGADAVGIVINNNAGGFTKSEIAFAARGELNAAFPYDIGHRYASISGFVRNFIWNNVLTAGGLEFNTREATGTSLTTKMLLNFNGNLILQNGGTFTDGGQRLQVQGTTLLNGNVTFSSATGMTWDATNSRLGIGTSSPDFALVVTRSGSQSFKINPVSGGVDMISTGNFAPHFTTNFIFYYGAPGSGVNKLALYGATGNLTIGGLSDAGYKLDVAGTTRITGAAIDLTNSAAILKFGTTNTVSFELQNNALAIKNGTATKFFIGASATSGIEIPSAYSIAFVNPGVTTFANINWNTTTSQIEFKNDGKTAFVKLQAGGIYGSEVGVGVTSLNASAISQIDSTTQGFLPPRMTTSQKTSIASPVAGLQVYDTTLNQMSYYNGTTWVNF